MYAVAPVVCEGLVCFGSWCLFLLGVHLAKEEIAVSFNLFASCLRVFRVSSSWCHGLVGSMWLFVIFITLFD